MIQTDQQAMWLHYVGGSDYVGGDSVFHLSLCCDVIDELLGFAHCAFITNCSDLMVQHVQPETGSDDG
jgi:hypothetical protein